MTNDSTNATVKRDVDEVRRELVVMTPRELINHGLQVSGDSIALRATLTELASREPELTVLGDLMPLGRR